MLLNRLVSVWEAETFMPCLAFLLNINLHARFVTCVREKAQTQGGVTNVKNPLTEGKARRMRMRVRSAIGIGM